MAQVDWSILSKLGDTLRENRQRQTLADLGRGLADGSLSYRQAAGLAAQAYRPDLSLSLLHLGEKKDQERDFGEQMRKLLAPQSDATSARSATPTQPPVGNQSVPAPQPKPDARSGMVSLANLSADYTQPAPPRAAVAPTNRVWGDQEAVDAGLYESPTTATPPSAFGDRFAQINAPQASQRAPATQEPPQRMRVAQASPQPTAPQGAPPLAPQNPITSNIPVLMTILSHPGAPAGQKKAAEIALQEAIKQPDNLREYQAYYKQTKAAGQQPLSLFDWTIKLKQSGATAITNDMRGESEYNKKMGGHLADMNIQMVKSAQTARGQMATLHRMGQLLNNPSVYTGAGSGAVLALKRMAKAVGVDVEGVADSEAARAIGNEFALQLRNPSGGAGMPGAMSDKDREFLTQIPPGLANTPEGNAKLLDYRMRLAQRDIDVERFRQTYVRRNGKLDEAFFAELAEWADKNPLFPEAANQPQQAAPSPGAAGGAASGSTPTIVNPATGERMTLSPDGRSWVPVPK